MRKILVLSALLLAACTTSADRMRSFVGRSLQDVMVYRGPPQNAFDMPDGRRAFQWIDENEGKTPVSVQNGGLVQGYGDLATWTQTTRITGGESIRNRCVYTMFGALGGDGRTWMIVGFEPPRPECNGSRGRSIVQGLLAP